MIATTTIAGVLLDIEGTTSSISFVYDVMFPFVRRELDTFLSSHWGDPSLADACQQIAQDAGQPSLLEWCQGNSDRVQQQLTVRDEVIRLMDGDFKVTGLKSLQGLIWKAGFDSGELVAHVYKDVVPAIGAWRSAGVDIRIYSSGSITAQKLFFGHTQQGDLLEFFSEHYDTTIGSKRESPSYARIVEDFRVPAEQILFISDVVAELDAAALVGMKTTLCCRPGNAEVPADHSHSTITSFAEIVL